MPLPPKVNRIYSRLKSNARAAQWMTPLARRAWGWTRDLARVFPLAHIPGLRSWSGRPRGYWPNLDAFAAAAPDGTLTIQIVEPAGQCSRTPPLPLAASIGLPHHQADPVRWPARRVVELAEVRIVGGYGASIIAADGRLVGDLAPDVWGIDRHELLGRLRLPKPRLLGGKTLVIATPEAPTNYSHWLFDLLPRLLAAEAAGHELAGFDHIVANPGRAPFCMATIEALGVRPDRVVPIGAGDAFQLEGCVTTTLRQRHWALALSPAECRQLAARLGRARSPRTDFPRRIFLPRGAASFRRLVNEGELAAPLQARGFEPFFPERFSFAEQVAAFAQAEVVVGAHSSSFSNLIFCAPGTRVLEIFPPRHIDFSWWTLASHTGLTYAAVVGRDDGGPAQLANVGTRFLDFSVDVAQAVKALDALLESDHAR